MDLVSHAFWAAALTALIKRKRKISLNPSRAVFWGMFPDLFAFVIPGIILLFGIAAGKMSVSDIPVPGGIGTGPIFATEMFRVIIFLYSFAHSLVVFSAVLLAVFLFMSISKRLNSSLRYREFPKEIFGWALHILIDIPTHSTDFFATPFLFPFSDLKFNGITWRTPWLLALNYLIMVFLYLAYFRKGVRKRKFI